MAGILQSLISAFAGAAKDVYFKYVTLLLPGNGTNGAQNNTFRDASTNNFTITRNGNTTQGTFTPFGSNWSTYFLNSAPANSGSGTILYVNGTTSSANISNTSVDFCLEFWFNSAALIASGSVCVGKTQFNSNANDNWYANVDPTTKLFSFNVQHSTNQVKTFNSTSTVVDGKWHHLAATRQGTTYRIFVDGNLELTEVFATTPNSATTLAVSVGGITLNGGRSYGVQAYLSNVRMVSGSAVYTASFTPSTTPLTAISGTVFLVCQSNRFIDNSTNNYSVTVGAGTPSVQRFSPFSPSDAYSTSVIGGSAYFDGTGDSLVTASNAVLQTGTNAFTLEGWIYVTGTTNGSIISQAQDGVTAAYTFSITWVEASATLAGNISNNTTTAFNGNAVLPKFAWAHAALVRDSSNNVAFFVNGSRVASGSTSVSISRFNYFASGSYFADSPTRVGFCLGGYVSNARYINGTAIYDPTQSTITVPTAPLTAITNTQLLLLGTNAGIIDNAMMNDAETVGDAQISTTQSKFGGSSMYFDGTVDRLVFPGSPQMSMGTGDFTIEGWIRRSDTNIRGIFQLSATAGGLATTNLGLAIGSDAGQVWRIYANNTGYNSTATWAINTWYHFALVKTAGNIKLYVDGTSVITQADASNYTGTFLCVGGFYDTTFLMNGYIDDLRITRGYARYTTNFTPPTAAFPTS